MLMTRLIASMLSVGITMGAGAVYGQDYPNKPVRIVTSAAGGSSDFMARLIAQGLSGSLGQQVIVENRAALTVVEMVAKALPDGYTLLLYGSVVWMEPLLREDVPWDPVRDFSSITLVGISTNILVVHPSLPVKSVKELIALAKAKPGELNYASSAATGSSPYLAAELFKSMAGVNIVFVPYKSLSQGLADVIGGSSNVQLSFSSAVAAAPHIKSGRLRALAVTSAGPSALAPGLPTVAASGLHGYEASAIYGMWVPAKTPATTINRLNQESVRVLQREDTKERFLSAGVEVVGSSPEQLGAYVRSDIAKWRKVIKDAGSIRAR